MEMKKIVIAAFLTVLILLGVIVATGDKLLGFNLVESSEKEQEVKSDEPEKPKEVIHMINGKEFIEGEAREMYVKNIIDAVGETEEKKLNSGDKIKVVGKSRDSSHYLVAVEGSSEYLTLPLGTLSNDPISKEDQQIANKPQEKSPEEIIKEREEEKRKQEEIEKARKEREAKEQAEKEKAEKEKADKEAAEKEKPAQPSQPAPKPQPTPPSQPAPKPQPKPTPKPKPPETIIVEKPKPKPSGGIPYPGGNDTSVNLGVKFANVNYDARVVWDTTANSGPGKAVPSTGYKVIRSYKVGNVVKVTGVGTNGWVRIDVDGTTAFVYNTHIKR